MIGFLFTMLVGAFACQTSTTTSTRLSDGVNSIIIESEGSLVVTLNEADAFQCSLSFVGRDSAESVFSEIFDSDSSTWSINIAASAASSSSANSEVFFSDANQLSALAFGGSVVLMSSANSSSLSDQDETVSEGNVRVKL
jgi:hypothetical protein